MTQETDYSEIVDGARGNYGWKARFDVSPNGYVGITQFDGDTCKDRVLLSPKQVRTLINFIDRRTVKPG